MKKKIFLAGLIAMILAVMTACGSEPSSDAANEQDTEETVEDNQMIILQIQKNQLYRMDLIQTVKTPL